MWAWSKLHRAIKQASGSCVARRVPADVRVRCAGGICAGTRGRLTTPRVCWCGVQTNVERDLEAIDTSFGLFTRPEVIREDTYVALGVESPGQLKALLERSVALKAEADTMRIAWEEEEAAMLAASRDNAEALRELEERASAEKRRRNEERLRVLEEKRRAEEEREAERKAREVAAAFAENERKARVAAEAQRKAREAAAAAAAEAQRERKRRIIAASENERKTRMMTAAESGRKARGHAAATERTRDRDLMTAPDGSVWRLALGAWRPLWLAAACAPGPLAQRRGFAMLASS